MISIIKEIEPYYSFIEAINQTDAYRDTVRSNIRDYTSSCQKANTVTFLVSQENIIQGIFSFLILPEEKYVESLWALSTNESAYKEMVDYLQERCPGFDCYFVYNPKNEILNAMMKKANAEFSPVQKEMEFTGNITIPEISSVQRLSNEYHQQYICLHNQDLYWTAEKIIESGKFITFISKVGEKVTGYVDISSNDTENHIMDILVSEEYRNQGYGRSLMLEAMNYSYPKKITLEVDEDNSPAKHIYESLGFHYLSSKDIVTAYLKLKQE